MDAHRATRGRGFTVPIYDVDIHWDFAKTLTGIEAASAQEAEERAIQICQEYNALDDTSRSLKMIGDGFASCADSYDVEAVRG